MTPSPPARPDTVPLLRQLADAIEKDRGQYKLLLTRTMREAADELDAKRAELRELQEAQSRWLAWSGGQYPDDSPGDVIAAEPDGTITLDDGITTWNPLRALAFLAASSEEPEAEDLRPDEERG